MPRRRNNRAKNKAAAPPASASPVARPPRQLWRVAVLLGVSLLAYGNALRNGFIADDSLQILRNNYVTDSHPLPEYFTTDAWFGDVGRHLSNYYRPLPLLVYVAEYGIFGERPWAWHLVNICANAAAVCAAYFLLLSLADSELAFWACLLFALHPMHVEAVAWIASLPDLICGLLLFLAMSAYHKARSYSGGRAWWAYCISSLAFFGAILTKETALLFPLLFLAYEFFYRQRPLSRLWEQWRGFVPFAVVLAVYFVLRRHALGAFMPSTAPYLRLSHAQLAFAVPVVLARYVGKLLLPLHFNFFYFAPPTVTLTIVSASAILFLVLLVALPFYLRSRQPLVAFGLVWFLLILTPALDINAVGENYFTERYLYVPSFGFVIFVAWFWLWLLRRARTPQARVTAWIAMAIVVVFCVAQIERRIPVLHDDLRLYQATVLVSPNSARLQAGLALAYGQAGNLPEAIEHYFDAVAIDPAYGPAQFNLGNALLEANRSTEAIEHLKIALALHSDDVLTLRSLAKAYVADRDWADAAQCYQRAAQLDPEHADYYQHFVDNLNRAAQIEKEIPDLRAQAEHNTNSVADWELLGRAYATLLDWNNAMASFEQALKIEPGDPTVMAEIQAVRAHAAGQ